MYLILTAIAAVITTIVWYTHSPADKYKLGILCLIYWGATSMWFVDHVITYMTEGEEFLDLSLNAALLGVLSVLIGLIAWVIVLLIKDPKGVFKLIFRQKN